MNTEGKSEAYRSGLAVRSDVLGKEYVERAFREADAFTADLQDFLTEHAWGAVWARPGLTRKTRSMLVIAMTAVLGRPHELEIHVRGALNNGVSVDEIKEVLLQAAVYGGTPACLDGFRVARKVLKEAGLI
ncbi:MAG: carboxymuconolactone decarboxylase family protein [Burkholderiales bacterium]|nr:MAG: carboxymuconolactone decarboxylase family protein [Burkholderiales bacterium]